MTQSRLVVMVISCGLFAGCVIDEKHESTEGDDQGSDFSGSGSDGAVRVRPDRFVGWRSLGAAAADPTTELAAALQQIRGRELEIG